MTAPLTPIRPLPALRLLSAVLVCLLALLGGAATARSVPADLPSARIEATATDAAGTVPILTPDRSAIDLDDAFERTGTVIDGLSTPKPHPSGAAFVERDRDPESVGSPHPERPPRD